MWGNWGYACENGRSTRNDTCACAAPQCRLTSYRGWRVCCLCVDRGGDGPTAVGDGDEFFGVCFIFDC